MVQLLAMVEITGWAVAGSNCGLASAITGQLRAASMTMHLQAQATVEQWDRGSHGRR